MFRAFPLPIIRSFLLYIRHWYISCSFQAGSGWNSISILTLLESCHKTCKKYTNVECTFGQRKCPKNVVFFFDKIKLGKFVRLVGFIKKKFVRMHGHMNVKFTWSNFPGRHFRQQGRREQVWAPMKKLLPPKQGRTG